MKTLYFRAGLFGMSLAFLLSSCGTPTEDTPTTASGAKTPFIIETVTIGASSGKTTIEKSGRIVASSSLVLGAQSAGEIAKILVKEGQSIKAGSTLINIKDSLTNLDLRLEQAENALEIQNASIDTTKANLDTSVENARISVERAEQSYESLTSKNNIQYDTLVNANSKTLDAYNGSYATYLADLDRNITQMLYEGDKILGISQDFDTATDGWDPYLGVRTGDTRKLAVNAWNNAYAARGLVRAKIEKGAKFEVKTIVADLALESDTFEALRKYVDAMVYMLQNNVVGGGLSEVQQNTWMASWNGFRAQVQGSESGFNAWKSQIATFIKSYTDTETATRLAVASLTRELTADEMSIIKGSPNLSITYENTRIDLEDKLKSAKLSLEQAQVGYKNAKILRDATIRQLLAGKRSAEIALEQAKRDYSKLRITAPVDGTITRVITSVGQTISVGTPTLEISGKVPEILLDIDDNLAKTLETGMDVGVEVDGVSLSGTITAVSQVSSSNLLSSLRIGVPTGVKYIGKSVVVRLTPGESEKTINDNILPLDAVHIISEGEGEINILSGTGEITKMLVKTGKIEGENIEILSKIAEKTKIILSDVGNYDPTKNTLTVQ